MRVLKRSTRTRSQVSLILVDWRVRESFHLLHYLKDQTVPRDAFEVVLIEYYDGVSEAASRFEPQIDTWILLEMPAECYYHKHLMYNTGVVISNGRLLMFMDSDAMVRPTFVEAILKAFERDRSIVYHMDEFRNVSRDYYPFNYPSFEDVLGDACINNVSGKTTGVVDSPDPSLPEVDQIAEIMHARNSGAAMCAVREDILAAGGADEDLSYLGHVCGPYEMTFRLMNLGRRMVWEEEEYLYHTWHPGSDGVDNYLGPHDGRNFSTTALEALHSGRVQPLVENQAIQRLRTGNRAMEAAWDLADVLIDPKYPEMFQRAKLGPSKVVPSGCLLTYEARLLEAIGACNICQVGKRFAVVPHAVGRVDFRLRLHRENPAIVWAASLAEAREAAHRMAAPATADSTVSPNTPASPETSV